MSRVTAKQDGWLNQKSSPTLIGPTTLLCSVYNWPTVQHIIYTHISSENQLLSCRQPRDEEPIYVSIRPVLYRQEKNVISCLLVAGSSTVMLTQQ